MACHGVAPGSYVMGVDDSCGSMWMAWVEVAVMGFLSVGVMVASPWLVRRRWWQSAGSVQVSQTSVMQWRRMAWSCGVISCHQSVRLWTAHSLGKFRFLGGPGCCGAAGGFPSW